MPTQDSELVSILNTMAAGIEMNVNGGTVDIEGEAKEIAEAKASLITYIEKKVNEGRINELEALNNSEIANISLNKMQIRIEGRIKELTPKDSNKEETA